MGYSFVESIYYLFITGLAVGYGDLSPTQAHSVGGPGRQSEEALRTSYLFLLFYIPISVLSFCKSVFFVYCV